MTSSNYTPKKFTKFQVIPAPYAIFVMPLILSIFMTFVVSFISTLRSVGFSEHLFHFWMGAWALSWVIAFPTLLMILPVVKKITHALVQPW
ncbi:DUF2798 domain-containing protein [Methylophilus sp. VKM B-3414]|uniref:DUF2798 domain-containing protein n=1 Tax=Methylophilus sp. VKM B-3414 TaxID=3076121 RepID=UPI0028C6A4D8|nr:DUF2798 domain-containing protein [Methylophilus sp. VKM B-3414]MDT7848593.1 DUF2798 domain-containing protein [Methylophilus sp. VKM B-3414]